MELEDLNKPMLYDYPFTQFYRHLQQRFVSLLRPPSAQPAVPPPAPASGSGGALLHDESEFLKSLIREQDQKLREYEFKFQALQSDDPAKVRISQCLMKCNHSSVSRAELRAICSIDLIVR